MIPWNRLPRDVQRTILGLVLLSGTISLDGCKPPPPTYDPPPPPSTTRGPSPTPITPTPAASASATPAASTPPVIYDPAPPPRTATPVIKPPIIFDPAPPPRTATLGSPSPVATIDGRLDRMRTSADPSISGARVRGQVTGSDGRPRQGITVELRSANSTVSAISASDGTFTVDCVPGSYMFVAAGDKEHAVKLDVAEHDVVDISWTLSTSAPGARLPLAEIRTVDIVWSDDLTFTVDTPWPGASYRWMTTGGRLVQENDLMRWEPPDMPGRYLLQLIADWGYDGIAIDALTLTVFPDGRVFVT